MDKCVTFVNGWHDDNKGDCAITLGTLMALRNLLGSDVRFAMVSQNIDDSQKLTHAYRHFLSIAGNTEIASSLLPVMRPPRTRRELYIFALIYLCRLLSASIVLKSSKTPGVRLIAESSLVVSKGGHMLHARKSNPLHLANLYSHLAPLIVARHYDVPFVLWGQSLGPFNNRLSQWLTRFVLKDAYRIGLRESLSYKVAQELRLDDKLVLVPDPAFLMVPTLTKRIEKLMEDYLLVPEEFLVLTVRQWGHPQSSLYKEYLDNTAILIRSLLNEGFAKQALIVVHTMGPTATENDAIASYEILSRLKGFSVSVVQEDFTPSELCALYGQAKLVIGTRFHSVILALAGGAPAYAISYFGPKSLGIMHDMGLADWVTAIGEVSPEEIQERILGTDLNKMREYIKMKVESTREVFYEMTHQLLKDVGLLA